MRMRTTRDQAFVRGRLASRTAPWLAALALALLGTGGAGARSVLYPRAESVLRFSHEEHRLLPCERCHSGTASSTGGSERDLPKEQSCRACHRDHTRRNDVAPQGQLADWRRCTLCHRGYRGRGSPPRTRWPATRIRFSHRMHMQQGLSCTTCHPVAKADRALPSMDSCMGCHRARAVSNRCASCHQTRKDGRLRLNFGDDLLLPQGTLKGDKHTPLFARDHGAAARSNRTYCETCHRPETCLSCHAGQFKPMSIHRSDYVTHHAIDARRDEPRCVSCHRTQTFCLSCHLRSGVSSGSKAGGFRPNSSLAFHPAGFNALRAGPGHHKFSARRNVTACASCHAESTCIRCHGSTARRGGGFSPHPPAFSTSPTCRSMLRRNVRVCLKCHVRAEARCR